MPGKMLGVLRPSIYRFKLGAFEMTTILDGAVQRDGPYPLFGANASAEEVEALAVANRLPPRLLEHPFIPCVLNTGKELILFDTGNGDAKKGAGLGNLVDLLPVAGYAPEDIDIVVITHGHPDHIAGLVTGAGNPAFPKARYVFGRKEFDYWKKGENIRERRIDNQKQFVEVCVPLADQSTFVEPGDDVVHGVTAIEAYGHSAGHMAFHIESEGQRLLIWGDITNHYVVSLQAPDWHGDFDDDKDMAVATRKRILDMAVAEKLWVIGFHMPFPGVGFVEEVGGKQRWTPVSYQLNF
jgi:glyoxylase-like metal-dependent hydrolase (beta-lactamase superfamily II)